VALVGTDDLQSIAMEMVINSDSTVTQLWSASTLRSPEDGCDVLSETLVLTRGRRLPFATASKMQLVP
jgi:hypothetical protein